MIGPASKKIAAALNICNVRARATHRAEKASFALPAIQRPRCEGLGFGFFGRVRASNLDRLSASRLAAFRHYAAGYGAAITRKVESAAKLVAPTGRTNDRILRRSELFKKSLARKEPSTNITPAVFRPIHWIRDFTTF